MDVWTKQHIEDRVRCPVLTATVALASSALPLPSLAAPGLHQPSPRQNRPAMPPPGYTFDTLDQFAGREIGVSGWLTLEQERIDRFAECTGDHQWIHVDAERARRESPFGTTIAHGFLTLSLLPGLRADLGLVPEGVAHVLNYGLDRVRFLAPVRAGARLRVRVRLLAVQDKGPGRKLLKTENTVEIEGEETPAMVAETLALLIAG